MGLTGFKKKKVSAELCSFWKLRENLLSCLEASGGHLNALAYGLFFHLQIEQHDIFKSPPDSSFSTSVYKGPCDLFQDKVSCNLKSLFLT